MRKLFVAIALGVLVGIAAPATAAPAVGDEASSFVARINDLRVSKGLAPLRVDTRLAAVAQNWTDRMAGAGQISHNRDLASEVAGDWVSLGENVGVGTDVPALMQAFVDSPTHYANLVDPEYNAVAVAVRWGTDGRLYTTHLFMNLPAAPAAAVAPVTSPAPQRVAVVLEAFRSVED